MMKHRGVVAWTLVAGLGPWGCEERAPTAPTPAPRAAAPASPTPVATPGAAANTAGKSLEVPGGWVFQVPEGWRSEPPANSMRLAELHTGEGGAGCVVVFSTAGGTVDGNIDRWLNQFGGAGATERSTGTAAGLTVHTVAASGTYTGMSEPARENWGLRGAIVEGSPMLFIKMTGPAERVAEAARAFDEMVGGMRRE